jgi:hypothetical protein
MPNFFKTVKHEYEQQKETNAKNARTIAELRAHLSHMIESCNSSLDVIDPRDDIALAQMITRKNTCVEIRFL